jgi:RNA-directed DNA polymerase
VWTSQRYISGGEARGVDVAMLERAAELIGTLANRRPPLPAILTLKHLAARSGASYIELRRTVERHDVGYRNFHIRKRSGGRRYIQIPPDDLMRAQRWLSEHVLARIPPHSRSFAFSKKASIMRCAAQHSGARWLIKMDVSAFFGSISEIQVYRVFLKAGYQPLVAFEFARLATYAPEQSSRYQRAAWVRRKPYERIWAYGTERVGYLPQGAPSSPMLSNLVMHDIDADFEELAASHGLTYTRYSDDLSFSTRKEFDRLRAKQLIASVTRRLAASGLRVNKKKTTVVPPNSRKIVLGLLVNGDEPRLTKEFRSSLRQHLYYMNRLGPRAHAVKRGFDTISGLYNHVLGLINYAKMVEPEYARHARSLFEQVDWPANVEP